MKFSTLHGIGLHGSTIVRLLYPSTNRHEYRRSWEDMSSKIDELTKEEKIELLKAVYVLNGHLKELRESEVKL